MKPKDINQLADVKRSFYQSFSQRKQNLFLPEKRVCCCRSVKLSNETKFISNQIAEDALERSSFVRRSLVQLNGLKKPHTELMNARRRPHVWRRSNGSSLAL